MAPPRKRKKAAGVPKSSNKEGTTRKRTRLQPSTVVNPPKPRPRPKMRPIPAPSPSPEPEDDSTPPDPKSHAKPANNHKGKGLSVHWETEEVDELLSSEEEAEDQREEPSSSSQPGGSASMPKIMIRLNPSAQTSNSSQLKQAQSSQLGSADPVEEGTVVSFESPDRIAFAIQKDGIESRPVPLPENTGYDEFRRRVAGEFRVVEHDMELVWKSNRMAKNAPWGVLGSTADFEPIMRLANTTIGGDSDKYCAAVSKNAANAKVAKRRGRDHVPKPVAAVRQFVILVRDRQYERDAKSPKKGKKAAKGEVDDAAVLEVRGLSKRILEFKDKIKARKCEVCGKSCVLVPRMGKPPEHRELSAANTDYWAQMLGKNTPGITLEAPPHELQLQLSDRPAIQRGNKPKSAGDQMPLGQPEPGPDPAPNPEQHAMQRDPPRDPPRVPPLAPLAPVNPVPHLPQYYHHYPPPPALPHGYYNHYYGPFGHPPPQPQYGGIGAPAGQVGGNMPLSEWLPRCDQGERGESRDNFSGLLAGFTAEKLHHLSDLEGWSEEDFLSTDFPTTPGGPTFRMARGSVIRLRQYISVDLR